MKNKMTEDNEFSGLAPQNWVAAGLLVAGLAVVYGGFLAGAICSTARINFRFFSPPTAISGSRFTAMALSRGGIPTSTLGRAFCTIPFADFFTFPTFFKPLFRH